MIFSNELQNRLLGDLEARFGSLLAVRTAVFSGEACKEKGELLGFLLGGSAFAADYAARFFEKIEIRGENSHILTDGGENLANLADGSEANSAQNTHPQTPSAREGALTSAQNSAANSAQNSQNSVASSANSAQLPQNFVLRFKEQEFLRFLDFRLLGGSFTAFAGKIGLANSGFEGKFIKKDERVVLNFPFKDGVLKGAQSADEDKSNEVFFNDILARDEIDVLFAPKILDKFEFVGENSTQNSRENSAAQNSQNPHENLLSALKSSNSNFLIKGNNLLALHSLKKRRDIYGRVKLIYIDPPYNTGSDSFNYNDRFNHSSWLCFMKNRLEIAREFLREDGVIFIQCDDNEQAYLKVLCDEIFGRENFVGCSAVIVNRGGRDYGGIAKTHEYLLIYAKTAFVELYQIEEKEKKFQYEDEKGGFNLMELRNRNIRFNKENRPNLYYPFYINAQNADKNQLLEISLTPKENFVELYPLQSQGVDTVWRWGKEKAAKFLNLEIKGKKKQDGGFMIVQKNRLSLKRQRSVWDDKEFVNERGTEHLKEMFGQGAFSYPKSEFLLKRIIEISTNEGDLVMDFFAGSGTTCAVAHKMKRRFVGIEQMAYIESITKQRLIKVINGEQGGISKAVNFAGGGGFIYAELMPLNAKFKGRIQNASENELDGLFDELRKAAFLDYRADFGQNLSEFSALGGEDKRRVLLAVLDSNMDYELLSDLRDGDLGLSSEQISLNEAFYGGGDE